MRAREREETGRTRDCVVSLKHSTLVVCAVGLHAPRCDEAVTDDYPPPRPFRLPIAGYCDVGNDVCLDYRGFYWQVGI